MNNRKISTQNYQYQLNYVYPKPITIIVLTIADLLVVFFFKFYIFF